MTEVNCERCAVLHAKLERIREILAGNGDGRALGRQAEYLSPHGRLIAATASAKGMKLSEVSAAAGFAPSYVAKICRGNLSFSRRAALLIGGVLGVDLLPFVSPADPVEEQPQLAGIERPESVSVPS